MSHHKSYAQVCRADGGMVLVFVFVHVCDYFCEASRNVITGIKGMQSSHF